MLLERGADPNLVIRSDEGPALRPVLAEYVASNENPSVEVVALLLKYGARVVIKTQFRDPHGILNSLQNTADKPRLLKALLEAAESFDPCMIRRSSSLTDAQKELVMEAARTPLPLTHQERLIVRKLCGTKLPKIVRKLQLPQSLHRYLLYDFHWDDWFFVANVILHIIKNDLLLVRSTIIVGVLLRYLLLQYLFVIRSCSFFICVIRSNNIEIIIRFLLSYHSMKWIYVQLAVEL